MVEFAALLGVISTVFSHTDKVLAVVEKIVSKADSTMGKAVEATYARDEMIDATQSLITMANAVLHSTMVAGTAERDEFVTAIRDLSSAHRGLLASTVIDSGESKVTARTSAALTLARIVITRMQTALHAEARARAEKAVASHDKKIAEGTAVGIPINQGLDKIANAGDAK